MSRTCAGKRAGVLAFAAICTVMGCSGIDERSAHLFANPGKYRLYDCQQLASKRGELVAREQELQALMARAEQGAAGALVSTFAYRSDYLNAVGERKEVEALAIEKECDYTRDWRSDVVIR